MISEQVKECILPYDTITLFATAFISEHEIRGTMYDTASLLSLLDDAVRCSVLDKDVAIAFSGGIDSGMIAAMARPYASSITLYTVGIEDSHDLVAAEEVGRELGFKQTNIIIKEEDVISALGDMIKITGTTDPVTLSFEMPLFFVCKYCREPTIVTGQGADELFGGYSKYIGLNKAEYLSMNSEDRRKLEEVTLPHESAVVEYFNKSAQYPFLNDALTEAVELIGAEHLLSTEEPRSRKKILREMADRGGYVCLSQREKKAAQYGSGVMVLVKRICKERNISFAELISELGGSNNDRY